MNGLKRLQEVIMADEGEMSGEPDASDAILYKGGVVEFGDGGPVARQAELASAVTLVLPAPQASTTHKSFDEIEGVLKEFLSSVMELTRDLTDAGVSAQADEAEIKVTWTVNPEDVARFISLAKQSPAWIEMQKLGASFQADK